VPKTQLIHFLINWLPGEMPRLGDEPLRFVSDASRDGTTTAVGIFSLESSVSHGKTSPVMVESALWAEIEFPISESDICFVFEILV
jgi:hypothetical protein